MSIGEQVKAVLGFISQPKQAGRYFLSLEKLRSEFPISFYGKCFCGETRPIQMRRGALM